MVPALVILQFLVSGRSVSHCIETIDLGGITDQSLVRLCFYLLVGMDPNTSPGGTPVVCGELMLQDLITSSPCFWSLWWPGYIVENHTLAFCHHDASVSGQLSPSLKPSYQGILVKNVPKRKAFLIVEEEKVTGCPKCYCEMTLVLWPDFLLSGYTLLSLTLMPSINVWVAAHGRGSSCSPSLKANIQPVRSLVFECLQCLMFVIWPPGLKGHDALKNAFLIFHKLGSHRLSAITGAGKLSKKSEIIHILGFMGHNFYLATTQFWCYRTKAAIENM